jgi:osmotically-inducible protein OsmY
MNRQPVSTFLLAAAAAVVILVPSIASAEQPQAVDLSSSFRSAGIDIDRLQVVEVGGIVIIRGRTEDAAKAADAGRVATELGYTRVANLVQVSAAPDDKALERLAERELSRHRSLDGCRLHVAAQHGVVTVGGKVMSDMQKEVAVELVRNIDGVRDVKAELTR